MKKVIDFIIIFLLVFLIIGMFNKKEEVPITNGGIVLTTDKNSYSIPASIKLNIKNLTGEKVTFDTCKDIILKSNSGIIDFSKSVICKTVELESSETEIIDYATEYKKLETAGEYYFSAKIAGKEPIASFELDNRGTISKIFIAFIYQPILNLIDWLILITGYSLGWGIIIMTIIVRILLLHPQHKMMVSQKKLQAVQPKIKKIQEEFKGQQAVLGQKLMALYKEEKVNPMGSCGFMLIQMPILFVLYNVILEIRDPVNGYYLYDFLAKFEIDKINHIFYGIDLFKTGMDFPIQGIILGLTVAGLQYFQIKLSLADKLKETKKGAIIEKKKDGFASMMPDPDVMNKFMLYGMPLMVGVFTFTFFAGLGIYWGISTGFMIVQQLVVNKIIKKNKK
ncbi:MAG: YidC/Oxa1 family membrane protein insertase [Candidatus Gracilibacteria bacterium]|nr:YidC/Oxa1 family membrane protein insertase [Candidatus Gracilibacteria bacterium]